MHLPYGHDFFVQSPGNIFSSQSEIARLLKWVCDNIVSAILENVWRQDTCEVDRIGSRALPFF